MKQLLEEFSKYLTEKKNYSDNTVLAYLRDLKHFEIFLTEEGINTKKFEKINRTNIMAYVMHLQKEKRLSTTVSRNIASVKAFYKYLVLSGKIKSDPSLDIDTPRIEKKMPVIISLEQVELLLSQPNGESLKEKRDKAMLEVLYATGIRVSELITLEIQNVNVDNQYIRCTFAEKTRVIPIGSQTVLALDKYIKESRTAMLKSETDNTLFVNCNGSPMTRQGFWKIIKSYAKKARIEADINPQTLRHAFAAHLVENGADLNSVKEMLGHADISTTQIYLQTKKKNLKDVYASTHPRY